MVSSSADSASKDGSETWRRGPLLRWLASSVTLSVPQAAGPVAFSLAALLMNGSPRGGAAMILAMTVAQVVGVVPISRIGIKMASGTFLRILILFRTLALASIVLCLHYRTPFIWLIASAALAGLVNGSAYGHLRSLLNHFVPLAQLPRALGVAATCNEVTYVLAPVAAAGLGAISPVLALLALTVLSTLPAFLAPSAGSARGEEAKHGQVLLLTPTLALWLACAAVGGSTVASVEIGAVALALEFGLKPAAALMFTVPLCLTSIAGGIWISVRNRPMGHRAVTIQLAIMTGGSVLLALKLSLLMSVLGALLIGVVLAPLGTHFALVLDRVVPSQRRAEAFALLRTASAIGVILASAVLAAFSLSIALAVIAASMIGVTLIASLAPATFRASS